MAWRITLLIIFMWNCGFSMVSLDESKSVITVPTVSSKCKVLIDQREKKLRIKQTLSALIERNIKLQHKEIKEVEAKRRLIANLRKLRNEYILAKNRVRYLTSEIVVTGCPGVTL